jgi:hypothetical protein
MRRQRRIGFVITAAFVLGAGLAHAARWPAWASDAADGSYLARFSDEDAVIAIDSWDVTLDEGRRTGTRRWVVHVLTEDGIHDASLSLQRSHFGGFDLDRVRMWVRDPSGRTTKYSDDDGSLYAEVDRRILDDTEILTLSPPAVRPGTKVAVEAQFDWKAELPHDLFYVQGDIPVVRSLIHVSTQEPWNVEAQLFRGDGSYGFHETDLTWEFTNVPGRAFEYAGYAEQPPLALLALNYSAPGKPAPFRTWADVNSWARELYRLPSSGNVSLQDLAASLPREPSQAVDAAGRLSRQLRYFGVELGWGGWRPRTPETTLRRAFGDCKDKAQLMVSLLGALGVEAYPTLIVARSRRHVPDTVPSPFVFNHVVVAIPWDGPEAAGMMIVATPDIGRVRIYDATLSDRSAQDVSPVLEGATALLLHPATTQLLRLPGSEPEQNVAETEHNWTLETAGALTARTVYTRRGVMRIGLEGDGGYWIEPLELRDRVLSSIADVLTYVEELAVSEVREDEDGAWSYETTYRGDGVLGEVGSVRSLKLGELLSPSAIPLPSAEDPESVQYLPFLGTFKETFTIRFPGYRLIGGSQNVVKFGKIADLRSATEVLPDGVQVLRELKLRDRKLTPEDREAALELRAVLRRINDNVLLFEAVD